jgi:hypothetical protein
MVQMLIVALLVAWCSFYAIWTLLPATAKRSIATRLLERRLPEFVARVLRRHASAATGCGCDGCDRSPKAAAPATSGTPITFHPRRQR